MRTGRHPPPPSQVTVVPPTPSPLAPALPRPPVPVRIGVVASSSPAPPASAGIWFAGLMPAQLVSATSTKANDPRRGKRTTTIGNIGILPARARVNGGTD